MNQEDFIDYALLNFGIVFLTLSGLVNGYCGVTFNDKVEVLIIGGSALLCYSCLIGKILTDEEEIT